MDTAFWWERRDVVRLWIYRKALMLDHPITPEVDEAILFCTPCQFTQLQGWFD